MNTNIDFNKLRCRFAEDRSFAERFFALTTELEDFHIDEIRTDAYLPYDCEYDPGAMVVMMKGQDGNGHPFIMVLLEPRENMPYLIRAYTAWLWDPYSPISDENFMNLPDLYEIAFEDKTTDAPELPILHVRTYSRHKEGDEWVSDEKEVYYGVFINLINVNAEGSEIMSLLAEVGIQ